MARLAEVALLFLVLLPVSSQLAGQGAGGVAPLVAPANCQGREQEWATCEGLPSCGGCVPHDCSFAAWNEWFKLGGCTGLCVRKRMVREANNECGNPCNGAQMETVHRLDCYPDIEDCILKPRNCTWKDWGDWSACLTTQGARNRLGQRYRKRTVEHVALNSGQVCAGPFNETEPCSASAKVELNCELSEWGAWTHCSASCAGGWQARMRRITQHALHGGTTCQEVTRMMQPCNVRACGGSRGCVMGEWEAWQGCDLLSPAQRYRSRKLTQPAEESGPPCNQPLQETQGCPDSDKEPVACQLSTWSAWGACSASCGGQAERTRGLQDDQRRCVLDGASAAGASLHEIKPCGVAKCFRGQCHTSDWTEWSSCSQHCGQGIHSRSREVLAVTADQGCDIALEEVKPCQLTPCTQIDCVWGEWDHFSACSDSCGGGSMRRIRVVKQPPRSGGKVCEAKDKSEIAPCNTETCQVCIDGRWGTWGAWSKCSATCSPSYRARHRSVEMHPNFCGRPADGVEDQYEVCQSQPNCQTSEDCLLSNWNEWTSCSCKCFGVRERLRSVARYATGNGKTCLKDSLKQVEPCSPGPGEAMPADCEPDPKRPCQVGEWEDWLGCSTSCGGGERKRSRGIMVPAADDGPPCEAALQHVEPCSTQDCHRSCVDCHWGAWSDWGECSKCGGQRYRHRAIETMRNHCGKKCIAAAAKELGSCQSHCAEKVFCTWSDWSEMGGCSAECGPSTKLLQRQLRLTHDKPNPKVELMAGTGGMCRDAAGQTYSGCPVLAADEQTCKKILLELAGVPGVRGAMFAPKSSALARAGRSCVLQVDAGAHVNASAVEGGWMAEPCIQGQGSGPIVEAAPNSAEASWSCMKLEGTAFLEGDSEMPCSGVQLYSSTCPVRPCEDQCSPEDCVLSQWSEWSAPSCTQLCERSRVLQKQNECGGKSCDGQLVDTKRCWKNCTAPVDCLFGDWSYWEPLTCVSEVDQKERSRTVLRTAKNGGENCEGPVRETLPCSGTPTLVADCLLGSWADWTACNRPCDQGLRTRSRVVAVQAQGGGQPCDGTLAEMQPCSLGPCERAVRSDGEFAPWSTWGDCSPSNMRVRTRKVAQEPTGGGKAAIGSVEETAECSEIMDCKVSDWTNWDLCDRSCGGGQQQRQRQVQGNPRNGGMKCPANLIETRGCKEEPCRAVDCEVTHWSDWASCSADCGNGYRERQRSIETLAEANGAGCALPLSELGECQGAEENCNGGVSCDCAWAGWSDWSSCTCDCNGGQKSRDRHILKAPGPGCKPCAPLDKEEIQPCNTQACETFQCIDAEWAAWGNWEPCSSSCKGGITWRTRRLARQPTECGQQASGLFQEHATCNEGISCVPSQDCEFGGWSAWGACSESCDGVKRRSRTIKQQGRGEGAFCEGPLKQTYPCSTGVGLLEFSSPSLYLNLQKLAVNSLSGKGEMRFSEVATVPGENCVGSARTCPGTLLDLLIKPSGKYFPGGSSGLFGEVGSISTAVGSTAVLDLHLVERVGADDLEVKPKMLMLKFFDVSDGVTLEVDGYDQVFLSAESQLQVQEESSKSPKGPKTAKIAAGAPSAGAPKDPMSLSPLQEMQSVAVLFKDTGHARVTFANRIGVGHNLLFAGKACFRGDCIVSACGRGEDAVDCVMQTWAEWAPCDASCGRGQRVRSRKVQSLNSHGGRPCHVTLSEMKPCESQVCAQACLPRNCSWGNWGEWGACDKCGGQMKRFRHVAETSRCGGQNCEPGAAEEIAECPRKCHELSYCAWGDWSPYSECTNTCGEGMKSRNRRLKVVNDPLGMQGLLGVAHGPADLEQKFQQLDRRATSLEAQRRQQLGAAFSAGFLGLVAMVALGRRSSWFSGNSNLPEHQYSAALMNPGMSSDGE